MAKQNHRLAAIMFTDIVGYTALMERDEDSALNLLQRNLDIHQSIIKQYKGELLKEMGDGLLISFATSSTAVRCASAIQSKAEKEGITLRIGIHEGELVFKDGDVFGSGVNIASRLQENADSGQIHVSHAVYIDIKNKSGIRTEFIGEKKFKNVEEPIKVYKAKSLKLALDSSSKKTSKFSLAVKRSNFIIGTILIFFFGILLWQILSNRDSVKNANLDIIEKSIAVLPFKNLSDEPGNEHFADGLVEDLLNRFSRIEDWKVISNTSSQMYRERGSKKVQDIAQELSVTHIVEGSVQRYGDKARITIQLIDGASDNHIWSNTFDRKLTDIFEIQSQIAQQVVEELALLLTSAQKVALTKNNTTSFKAFDFYQMGMYFWNKRNSTGYQKSIEYFEKALEEDPQYALAYAGLADTYMLMALQGHIDGETGIDKALLNARQALEIDENSGEAYTVIATINDYVKGDWEEAEKMFQKALDLNPNHATTHQYYSEHLAILGKAEDARKHINIALELDPHSYVKRMVSTIIYYHSGNFKEASVELEKCWEIKKDHGRTSTLLNLEFYINFQLGHSQKAFDALFRIAERFPKVYNLDSVQYYYDKYGIAKTLEYTMADTEKYGYLNLANDYALLGKKEEALKWLEKYVKEGGRATSLLYPIGVNYHYRDLRADPRYNHILEKWGLKKYLVQTN